jgi:hypothetical protein
MGCDPTVRPRYIVAASKSNNAWRYIWGESFDQATRYCFLILTEFCHVSSMPSRLAMRNRVKPTGGR